MIYLDTSALIKRFVNEKGSLVVRSLVQQDRAVATAKIAYAEIFAGLTRKLREGNLAKAQYALACRQFDRDWHAHIRVELGDDLLLLARDLIQHHPLMGSDAVHLASALSQLLTELAGLWQDPQSLNHIRAAHEDLRAGRVHRLKGVPTVKRLINLARKIGLTKPRG